MTRREEAVFFQTAEREQIVFSSDLHRYLIDEETGTLKPEWGKVLAFLVLYAIFPGEVNQLYGPYFYRRENESWNLAGEPDPCDRYLFQSEYPPDMGIYQPGEMVSHTWILKNVGEVFWENRYMECDAPPFPIKEEAIRIRLPEAVYPGDSVSPAVCFRAPEKPGSYTLNWKMKDENGRQVFLDKLGVGLHFIVSEKQGTPDVKDKEWEDNNYKVLEEKPPIPVTVEVGTMYTHIWMIENTGTVTWTDYYCECINGDLAQYTKNELRIPLKKRIRPGEKISVKMEFVTPPIEGVYRLMWKIMKSDGSAAFSEERRLEVLLNVI